MNKEKIKLGIPIEDEATGKTNVILRTNEIRIVEEAFEEIERLHSIIKEVREYIEEYYESNEDMSFEEQNKLLQILDKEVK